MIKSCLLKSKSQIGVDMLALDVYSKLSLQFCFIAEYKGEPVAFIFASPHANDFYEYFENHYVPIMRNKTSSHTENFCSKLKPSDLVLIEYPSKFLIETMDNQHNLNINFIIHQLFDILFLTLKSQGSYGVYTSFDVKNASVEKVLVNFGFQELPKNVRDEKVLSENNFYARKLFLN